MSEADYRQRDQDMAADKRDKWMFDRAEDLRARPTQLVKALNEIHGEDLTACLTTLIVASKMGPTQSVIDGWISMVLQDEEARGEWRGYEPD